MTLQFDTFLFKAKCNYLLSGMDIAVKLDKEELPARGPLSIVLQVEIPNMDIGAFCQQVKEFVSLNTVCLLPLFSTQIKGRRALTLVTRVHTTQTATAS